MRFEEQRYWDTEKRLKRWVKNQYSSDIKAASERLTKTRKKQGANVEEMQQQAQEREQANEQLEREIAERKARAVTHAEWLAMKAREESEV